MGDYEVRNDHHVRLALMMCRGPDHWHVGDNWSVPGRFEDVFEIVKGWDPRSAA